MRPPPRARAALTLLCVAGAIAAALAGCGRGRTETESALELEESRPYGPVVVRSELAPKRATLGDPARWTLTATLPAGARPGELRLEPPEPGLEIEPAGEASSREGRRGTVWSRAFAVRGFDLGALALPAASLAVTVAGDAGAAVLRDTLRFPSDSLAIDSLTTGPALALEPDRGPIDPGWRARDVAVAVGIGIVLLAVAAAILLAWRRQRRAREIPPIPVAPEVPFLGALDALRREGGDLPRDLFHERLSDAVRRYVSAVTGVDALDRTTRELEAELRTSGRARAEATGDVVRLLRRSDLVKFARRPDDWAEVRALLDDAARLAGSVARTPPPEAPAVPPPPRGETARGGATPPGGGEG